MPEPAPLDGPTVSIRLARALSAGKTDAATVAKQISAAPPPKDPNLPRTVGRYRILDRLGRGGMGVVYGAWDDRLQRPVALKMLRAAAADPDDLARFQREVRIAASLKHPGIVAVHEVGSDGADPFFTMDIVDGVPLDAWCTKQALGRDARVDLVSKVAQAVHHAHTRGVLHRDLKPGNILVREDGQPVILDFGLAKPTAEAESTFNTMTGTAMGTPAYMSPEQAGGRVHEVDTRTDVYALGVIPYQLVTGRLPFEGRDPMEICRKVVEEEVPRPSTRGLRLPADLETVILKTLEKDPSRRYPSALHLDEELRRYLTGEPITARKASAWYRIRRRVARNPVVSSLAAALVLSVLGGGVWIAKTLADKSDSIRQREEALLVSQQATHDREAALDRLERDREALSLLDQASNAMRLQGDPTLILSLIDRAISLAPDNTRAIRARAWILRRLGRDEDAITALRRAIELAPDDPDNHVHLSRALMYAQHIDEGTVELATAARLAPGTWIESLNRAIVLMNDGRSREAEPFMRSACAQVPADPTIHCFLAVLLVRLGAYTEALAQYDAALTLGMNDPLVLSDRAAVFLLMNRPEVALAAADAALVVYPTSPQLLAVRSKALVRLARAGDAIDAARTAAAAAPADPNVRTAYGQALLMSGRAADALTEFNAALDARPRHVVATYGRAEALRLLDRLDEALVAYDAARDVDPDSPEPHLGRAYILLNTGRTPEALDAADEALRISPRHSTGHAARAQCLHRLGRFDEALDAIDQTISLSPPSAVSLAVRASILERLDRLPEALAAAEAALALPSPPAYTYRIRGIGRLNRGDPAGARADLERFLSLEPDHPRAEEIRRLLQTLPR